MVINIRNNDTDLYNKYLLKVIKTKDNEEADKVKQVWNICYLIKNGIRETGQIRNFTISDYCKITNFSFEEIKLIGENWLSLEDYKILLTFIKQNSQSELINDISIKTKRNGR